MLATKRRHSDSDDSGSVSVKVPRTAGSDSQCLESSPADECFQVEVKLRSTSKGARNDPKSPGYYERQLENAFSEFPVESVRDNRVVDTQSNAPTSAKDAEPAYRDIPSQACVGPSTLITHAMVSY